MANIETQLSAKNNEMLRLNELGEPGGLEINLDILAKSPISEAAVVISEPANQSSEDIEMEDLSLRKDKLTDGKVSFEDSNEKTFDMQKIEQFEQLRDSKLSSEKGSKEPLSAESSLERSKSITEDLPKTSSLEED
jgi:hypothetical protein